MKNKTSNSLVLSILVTMILFVSSATQILAQCTTCAPSSRIPNAITCQPSSSGGRECQATGDVCTLAGACRDSGDPKDPIDPGPVGFSNIIKPEIDDSMIRNIALTQPRFAYALAILSKNGSLGKDAVKIYIVPKPITTEDIERILSGDNSKLLPTEASLASGSKRKIRKQEKIVPAIYEVGFIEASKLTLKVIQGVSTDPSFSRLEIDFTEINGSTQNDKILRANNFKVE